MTNMPIADVDGLTAADVLHPMPSRLDANATVAELRDYFAASSSRRLAVLVDGDHYVGAIDAERFATAEPVADGPARDLVDGRATVTPDAPAAEARDRALATPTRRVPVVAADGRLVGIVAVDKRLEGFCGTEAD